MSGPHQRAAAGATGVEEASSGDEALAALVAALAALDRPAVLVRGEDIVFANARARPSLTGLRRWLRAGRPRGFAAAVGVSTGGNALELVLPSSRAGSARGPLASAWHALPPSLHVVADLLAHGATDKEIAYAVGKPLATARTYAQRVLERLDLRSRRDLVVLSRPPSGARS